MAVKSQAHFEQLVAGRDANLRTGALVRIKPEFRGRIRSKTLDASAPLVVFADKFDMANCVPIGGTANGAYHRIPANWLSVINPANVAIAD